MVMNHKIKRKRKPERVYISRQEKESKEGGTVSVRLSVKCVAPSK